MANRCIARRGFHAVNRALCRSANKRLLYAAMLVAERYFKVIDEFAMALKAEMPRLDDSGVYRTDGHFVDFFAAHGEETGSA